MNAVIFDSNIYRGISRDDFQILIEQERKEQFTAFANVWVIRELLAHLADTSDESFGSCRRALEKLYQHCFNKELSMLRLVPEVRANIENMLLGVSEVRKEEIQSHAKNLSQLVFAVYDSKDSGDINQSIINDCQSIEKVNAQKKILFARAISSAYRANAWNSELLLALIIALFQGENSQNINVQNVERFLRVPLYLLTDVLNRRSPNGLDENNKVHRNFLVDFDLFCSVGTQVNNMPVYFITNESKLIASVTGHSPDIETHVMDLPSYLQLLRV